jgi:hypothetical protein
MNVMPVYYAESGRITGSFDLATGQMGGEVQQFKTIKPELLPDDKDVAVWAEKALEARARRAAKSAGFIARKSRSQVGNPLVNQGGFQIMDGFSGFPVFGWTFDLSAQDVLDWLADDSQGGAGEDTQTEPRPDDHPE